jgi:hypothetical protein
VSLAEALDLLVQLFLLGAECGEETGEFFELRGEGMEICDLGA